MISEENQDLLRLSLTQGMKCGILLIVMMGISYALGHKELITIGLGHYILLSINIYFCQRVWKKIYPEVKYGKLLIIGLICGIGASLFVDLYIAIYTKHLNQDFVMQSLEQSKLMLKEMKIYSEAEMEMAMGITSKMFLPIFLISNTIVYSIVTAILSAFSAFLINKQKSKK